jgi:hypothetical protein
MRQASLEGALLRNAWKNDSRSSLWLNAPGFPRRCVALQRLEERFSFSSLAEIGWLPQVDAK